MEFTSSPGTKVFNKNPGIVLPFENFIRPTSSEAIWHEKKIVQDALNCCLASYKNLSDEQLRDFLNEQDSFFPKMPESINFGEQKSVLALSEDVFLGQTIKTMFVAFQGTDKGSRDDIFTDIDTA